MLKVKLVPMTLMVPVIDNSGDHDMKMTQDRYLQIQEAISVIGSIGERKPGPETVRQGVSQNARSYDPSFDPANDPPGTVRMRAVDHPAVASIMGNAASPVSQIDPVIDTTVRDSEMRSTAPEMTLDELRERPERTKAPPRPRANSWRHE